VCLQEAGSEWKHCPPIRDESDNCDVFYIYHYNPDIKTVKVQKTKRTFPFNSNFYYQTHRGLTNMDESFTDCS